MECARNLVKLVILPLKECQYFYAAENRLTSISLMLDDAELLNESIENYGRRQLKLQNSFLDGDITSVDYNGMKSRIESEISEKKDQLSNLKSVKSPFKVYLNKTLPMIENLSVYWDKSDGKTKQKILGCIFTEKFENFDFESCNNIFTPEIESIMLASKVLKGIKKKKEVKNDLLSNMAPLLGLEPRTP